MKACKQYQSIIDDYIDNLLSEKEKKEFEKHINECQICNDELNIALSIRREIKNIQFPEPPSNFLDCINASIDNEVISEKKKIPLFLNRRSFSAIAACALIAVFLGINSNNELTEKISMDEDNSNFVFKDILKQDKNTPAEFISLPEDTENILEDIPTKEFNEDNSKNPMKQENEQKYISSNENDIKSIADKSDDFDKQTNDAAISDNILTNEPVLSNTENEEHPIAPLSLSDDVETNNDSILAEKRSSGSGSGSSARSLNNFEESQNTNCQYKIIVNDLNKAKEIAQKICPENFNEFYMTAAQTEAFLEELKKADIKFSGEIPEDTDVRIILEAED